MVLGWLQGAGAVAVSTVPSLLIHVHVVLIAT